MSAPDPVADRRRFVATHEAGHAVVGRALGLHVKRIRFKAKGEQSFAAAGVVYEEAGGDTCALIYERPETMAKVLVAGALAEYLLLGSTIPDSNIGDNTAYVQCHPERNELTEAEFLDHLRGAFPEVTELIDQHEGAIRRLADALMTADEMSGEACEPFLQDMSPQEDAA